MAERSDDTHNLTQYTLCEVYSMHVAQYFCHAQSMNSGKSRFFSLFLKGFPQTRLLWMSDWQQQGKACCRS
jgi:hypothetical protein